MACGICGLARIVPRSHIQVKAVCCLFVTAGIIYAFLADKGMESRSWRNSRERHSTRIVALRSSWDCLRTAGFKGNNGKA
jgi:hypothetical protein